MMSQYMNFDLENKEIIQPKTHLNKTSACISDSRSNTIYAWTKYFQNLISIFTVFYVPVFID